MADGCQAGGPLGGQPSPAGIVSGARIEMLPLYEMGHFKCHAGRQTLNVNREDIGDMSRTH